MEQHVDQHAVLNPMGDAPMASSVSAVVALPVDPTTPATAPLDDVTIGTGGSASDTATSVDNSASTQLLVTSDGSQASTLSADFGDFDATESSPESSTVIPTDDGSSGASSDDIPPGGVNTPAVPAPTPAPNVIHCGTPGCRRFPGSDPSGPLQVDQHICCGACRFSNGGTHTLACDSVNLAPAPIPPPLLRVVVAVVTTQVALRHWTMIGDLDGTITALAVPFDSKRMPFDSKRLPPIVNTSFCWILR